jgi:hypothetical protein
MTFWGPAEGNLLLCQVGEWFGDVGEVGDEWPLIAEDTQYAANFLYFREFTWPIL